MCEDILLIFKLKKTSYKKKINEYKRLWLRLLKKTSQINLWSIPDHCFALPTLEPPIYGSLFHFLLFPRQLVCKLFDSWKPPFISSICSPSSKSFFLAKTFSKILVWEKSVVDSWMEYFWNKRRLPAIK